MRGRRERSPRARRTAFAAAGGFAAASGFAAAGGFVLAACLLACSGETTPRGEAGTAQPGLDDQECAVCGMLVRDQPAPRARVAHRDGSEAFTCSLGDLMVHLAVPSPHGRVNAVQVEVLEPDEDPAERATHEHAWVDAGAAWYVVGVERRGVMGPPVLAYAKRADAERAASGRADAHVFDLPSLRAWWKAMHR